MRKHSNPGSFVFTRRASTLSKCDWDILECHPVKRHLCTTDSVNVARVSVLVAANPYVQRCIRRLTYQVLPPTPDQGDNQPP